jgi:hypothetical protein
MAVLETKSAILTTFEPDLRRDLKISDPERGGGATFYQHPRPQPALKNYVVLRISSAIAYLQHNHNKRTPHCQSVRGRSRYSLLSQKWSRKQALSKLEPFLSPSSPSLAHQPLILNKMSSYSSHLHRILPPLTSIFGIVALSHGIYGLINPQEVGTKLGIPISSTSSSSALSLVSFIGARNIATGLTVLALLYTGQKQAVGTLFMCLVSTAAIDAFICFQTDRLEGKAVHHATMGVILGSLGVGMYWVN